MTERSPDGEQIDSPAQGQFDIYIVSVNGGHGAWRTLVIQAARQVFPFSVSALPAERSAPSPTLKKPRVLAWRFLRMLDGSGPRRLIRRAATPGEAAGADSLAPMLIVPVFGQPLISLLQSRYPVFVLHSLKSTVNLSRRRREFGSYFGSLPFRLPSAGK
jgi:hypothetical protein